MDTNAGPIGDLDSRLIGLPWKGFREQLAEGFSPTREEHLGRALVDVVLSAPLIGRKSSIGQRDARTPSDLGQCIRNLWLYEGSICPTGWGLRFRSSHDVLLLESAVP
jgi:hypothetical protein